MYKSVTAYILLMCKILSHITKDGSRNLTRFFIPNDGISDLLHMGKMNVNEGIVSQWVGLPFWCPKSVHPSAKIIQIGANRDKSKTTLTY